MLGQLGCSAGSTILDPWNGAGTTTQVAFDLGHNVVGLDINPVMALVARSRLLNKAEISGVRTKAKAVISIAKASRRTPHLPDALTQWFQLPGIAAIRAISRAIEDVCELTSAKVEEKASLVDEAASFLFVCLFAAVRKLSGKAKCSNPTWILRIRDGRSKVSLTRHDLISEFSAIVAANLERFESEQNTHIYAGPITTTIQTADSRLLPIASESIDAVITSPPYCTRIDYSVTTSIERAIAFGSDCGEDMIARDDFMGTSTIRGEAFFSDTDIFSGYVSDIVTGICNHPSYASLSYYVKTYRQYFFDLEHSLAEIVRVLRPGGKVVLVVQDSYYKNLHIDLARACNEILSSHGLSHSRHADFSVTSDIAAINTNSKRYRPKGARHTESVVVMAKQNA